MSIGHASDTCNFSPSDNEWLMFYIFYSKQSLSNDVNPDVLVYILKCTHTIIYEKKFIEIERV